MNVTIRPSVASGVVDAPPSKSISHRALLCGALSEGSRVMNVAYSQDIEATLRCLQAMGATVCRAESEVSIGGLDPRLLPDNLCLDCGESGSTLRFLLPLCLLCGKPVTLCGSQRLLERPLDVYERLCAEYGMLFERTRQGITVCGVLNPGRYAVSGKESSQFITGLLYALSLLEGDSVLEITDGLESESYVNLTLATLSAFGVSVRRMDRCYMVPGAGRYHPLAYSVEGDCSNAAFLDALSLFGGCVKVNNLTLETAQGDRVYRDMFAAISGGGREFDLSDCPDLGPIMFAVAAAMGGARFTGTARLRIKESDRIATMAAELSKFGIQVCATDNEVIVSPGVLQQPTESLCGHNDHRIVMALCVLCTLTGGTITGAEAVAKSYPDFFDVLRKLRIGLTIDEIG
ncbi:MAG: 3-phosphoshikimate 1-carboxyvinyltransferase [Clostridia bacterium]|nr:3-phosphoshikimate 1-carboxyvinyltransferase [Clostridia bacterium]